MSLLARLRGLVSGREHWLAYAIAALTVAACWAVVLAAGDRIKTLDEEHFVPLARNLALAGRYTLDDGVATALRAPGLAFFLVPVAALGGGLVEMRLANAALVGLGLVVLFHLVRRIAGPLAGLFAVAMVPAWPVVIYAATALYPQTLAAFLLVLCAWFLDGAGRGRPMRSAALAGLVYGLLILTLPIVLLLLPLAALWLILHTGRRLAPAVLFCAVAAACVVPWTVRNHAALGAFVPVATTSGYNLLAGNAPEARYDTSTNVRFPDYVYTEITGKSELERDRIFTEAAFAAIAEDPGRAAALYGAKFLHWFDYSNKLTSDEVVEGGASAVSVDTREMVLLASYVAVIALPLVLRLAMARAFPFRPVELFFLCLWVAAGLAYALFFTRVRFRLPFDWLVIASNAMFLAALVERAVDRAGQRAQGRPR